MTVRDPPATRRSRRWVVPSSAIVAILLCGTWAITDVRIITVTSGSMAPTYGVGDRFIATSLGSRTPSRGDVVVFEPPAAWVEGAVRRDPTAGSPDRMVKRVVAVAGDEIECCSAGGELLLNSQRLDEPYLARSPATGANLATFRVTVPAGSVWVMGDNRALSFDSRAMNTRSDGGFLPVSTISGRVLVDLP